MRTDESKQKLINSMMGKDLWVLCYFYNNDLPSFLRVLGVAYPDDDPFYLCNHISITNDSYNKKGIIDIFDPREIEFPTDKSSADWVKLNNINIIEPITLISTEELKETFVYHYDLEEAQ